jgi:hypothetical protein
VRRQLAHQCSYDPAAEETAGTQRRREPPAVRAQAKKYSQAPTPQLVGDEGLQAAAPRCLSEPLFLSDSARPGLSSDRLRSLASSPSLDVLAYSNQIGFMGNSSYSVVFDQINRSLNVPETRSVLGPAIYASPVPEDLVRKGAEVLFHLRDLEMLDSLLQRWLLLGDGYLIFEPIYRIWMREITEQLGPILRQASSPDDLRNMSIMLWRSTRMPIEINGATTARDWAQRTAGPYLRWEVLGLLFSAIGVVSGSLSNRDAIFASYQSSIKDRPTLVRTMLDLVNRCIEFCKVCMNYNDLYACLLVGLYCGAPPAMSTIRGLTYKETV